jgi:alpha-glucoside transport system permease protein
LSGSSITAEPPPREAPPAASGTPGRLRAQATTIGFLLPAAVFLAVWVLYPMIYTVVRSFFGKSGFGDFVGIDNYKSLFVPFNLSSNLMLRAIRNNAIWVAVVPALITAIGLIFAVLTERVRWSIAFKTAVFMPMAISLFAAGVIWRIMDQQDPQQGAVNAAISSVRDVFVSPGPLSTAQPSTNNFTGSTSKGLVLKTAVQPGSSALMGLTAIPPADVPKDAVQAVTPPPPSNGISGTVWRDFKPGGGKPGVVERGELGIPNVSVDLLDSSGKKVDSTKTEKNGSFVFSDLKAGQYRAEIGSGTFTKPFGGVSWLGASLVTPAIIIAYIWVWAGFAMVVIAAGLAAIPRDVLEAARTDGGTEWQVFRRVTVPLLAPVLSVVFITMLINVLKVFDIVISVAPGSTQSNATVIAVQMWRTSFGGVNDFGLGSAIAVFLFILVIPVLLLNIRRFKREA